MPKVNQARALQKAFKIAAKFPFVTGVDFGLALKEGKKIKRLAVRFYVVKKLPEEVLDSKHILPKEIDGIRCDVIEARFVAHGVPDYYTDYLQPGLSIGNEIRRTSGTAGPCVIDNVSGRIGFLSCWHVMCGGLGSKRDENIVQPGTAHEQEPARLRAHVERFLDLDDGYDAALALLPVDSSFEATPWGMSKSIVGVERPRRNMKVYKVGAETGLTYGVINSEMEGSYDIYLGEYGAGIKTFKGFKVELPDDAKADAEVSIRGDSGALWVNADTDKAVGLNFGGVDKVGSSFEYALSHQLVDVLKHLKVSLYLG
ncbi:hypothetical protein [Pseudomonas fluorescens]|uniref:hypothetical protein n=1 Tax=Pseudomonas fluorescens TaxID=294 RepID=UPI0012423802|nr:hypothetical protein [Pseudomonas fluorescens]VVO77423.1 hypothetical protein PS898_01629 [Pseudomonas fluorescens]